MAVNDKWRGVWYSVEHYKHRRLVAKEGCWRGSACRYVHRRRNSEFVTFD